VTLRAFLPPLAVLPFICALFCSSIAHAQNPDAKARAQELFKKGLDARDAKDCKTAIPLFRASLATYASHGARYNLALCEEQMGRIASAWNDYKALLANLSPADERQPKSLARIDALGPRIPHLRIDLAPDAPAGTTITLDGDVLDPKRIGVEIPLDPGEHTMTASVRGERVQRFVITLAEKDRLTLAASPLPTEPQMLTPGSSVAQPREKRSMLPAVMLWGVGGAAVVAGAVLEGVAASELGAVKDLSDKIDAAKTNCVAASVRYDASCNKLESQTKKVDTLGRTGVGLLVVGGAAAAGGLVYFFWPEKRAQGAVRPLVVPVVSAGGGGLVVSGTF
jgi:hypothetical protein